MEAAKDDWGLNVAKFPFVSVTDPAIEVPALFFKVYVDVVTVAALYCFTKCSCN